MKEQQVLITGGAGFIGSHLCERLVKEGWKVICLDNFNTFYSPKIKEDNIKNLKQSSDFLLVKGDILDRSLLEKIFSENKISKIIHLAALAGVRTSFAVPAKYVDVDVKGTVNLLEIARKHNIEQFIFGSSSSVYGVGSDIPFNENENKMVVISPYSSSKRAAEIFCQFYNKIYKVPITILRFFTVYGPRQRPEMAIHKFTRLIKQKKPIFMYGDGSSARDYTYIDDIVEGITRALKKVFDFQIFNLGSSRAIQLKEMIKILENKLNISAKIKKAPFQAGDAPITFADIRKARKILGWAPQISFEQGIEKFIEWYNQKEGFLIKQQNYEQ